MTCRYDVMTRCWGAMPCQRPTFTDLRNQLDRLLEECSPVDYLAVSPSLTPTPHDVIVESSDDDDADDVSVFGSGFPESPRKLRRSVSDCERYTRHISDDVTLARVLTHARDDKQELQSRRSAIALLPIRIKYRAQDDVIMTSAGSSRRLLSRSSLSTSDPGYETQKSCVTLAAHSNSDTQL